MSARTSGSAFSLMVRDAEVCCGRWRVVLYVGIAVAASSGRRSGELRAKGRPVDAAEIARVRTQGEGA